jgi:SAM-dependent methyltransferase
VEREPGDCCFDAWASANARRARRTDGAVAGISRALLGALVSAGVDGRSILDLGCGTGDLALAAVASGASRATGLDLGPGAVSEATALARERHLEDRATFIVGDAAVDPLARHDVVVLNRVMCCYPEVDPLISNSLSAAGRLYAFTAPPSDGLAGSLARIEVAISNAWFRLRDAKFRGFRVYVHDLDAVDARIRAAGFRPFVRRRRRFRWNLAVYRRADEARMPT